jgi:hypothetical protein
MSTLARAWDGFMQALAETSELQRRGADASTLAELLRHARELLDIIEGELSDQSITIPSDARAVLAQLRGRLESLEQQVLPTKH